MSRTVIALLCLNLFALSLGALAYALNWGWFTILFCIVAINFSPWGLAKVFERSSLPTWLDRNDVPAHLFWWSWGVLFYAIAFRFAMYYNHPNLLLESYDAVELAAQGKDYFHVKTDLSKRGYFLGDMAQRTHVSTSNSKSKSYTTAIYTAFRVNDVSNLNKSSLFLVHYTSIEKKIEGAMEIPLSTQEQIKREVSLVTKGTQVFVTQRESWYFNDDIAQVVESVIRDAGGRVNEEYPKALILQPINIDPLHRRDVWRIILVSVVLLSNVYLYVLEVRRQKDKQLLALYKQQAAQKNKNRT